MTNGKFVITAPKVILSVLWEVGEITIKSFFPHPYYHAFCEHHHNHNIHTSFTQLKKRGIIKKDGEKYRLTPLGKEKAFWAHLENTLNTPRPKPENWDHMWRLITFDIPEKKRSLRDELRSILKILGFRELQKSIWVSPYEIPALVNELITSGKIQAETRILTVKEINYDKDLKKYFKLN
jgi:CRISPR-associated endonuclease Cas2